MTYNEEWVKAEHDWLLAQFQIVCGSMLATLLALLFGALVGQVSAPIAWFTIPALAVETALTWRYYARASYKLRESLRERLPPNRKE